MGASFARSVNDRVLALTLADRNFATVPFDCPSSVMPETEMEGVTPDEAQVRRVSKATRARRRSAWIGRAASPEYSSSIRILFPRPRPFDMRLVRDLSPA